jgi:hypothetical protein
VLHTAGVNLKSDDLAAVVDTQRLGEGGAEWV